MIPKESKRLAEVDFPIALVSKHSAGENFTRHNIGFRESLILTVRGQKALLDSDLAAFCGVETKMLNPTLKRNPKCAEKED